MLHEKFRSQVKGILPVNYSENSHPD